MKWKFLFLSFMIIIGFKPVIAQNSDQIFRSIQRLYNNLNVLHNNLYFYNQYGSLDTTIFNDESIRNYYRLIRTQNMQHCNIDFDSLSLYIPKDRIMDEIGFEKIPPLEPKLHYGLASYSEKIDSFINYINLKYVGTDKVMNDSFIIARNLLLRSSSLAVINQAVSQAQKKLLKILSIYKNDKFILIIYGIKYFSVKEILINSDLILN